ncbi:MAG: hypothetical protein JNJ58_03950 [Chitinophagaceae bacterium]|nr:hypothetical protein [Chitinophagaceae bacterium]
MSYIISIYRKTENISDESFYEDSFWDKPENMPVFTALQRKVMHDWLIAEGYHVATTTHSEVRYRHLDDDHVRVTLQKCELTFTALHDEPFDIANLASEIAREDDFILFDHHTGEWEFGHEEAGE